MQQIAALISLIKDVRDSHFFLHQFCLITFHGPLPLRKCITWKRGVPSKHLYTWWIICAPWNKNAVKQNLREKFKPSDLSGSHNQRWQALDADL